MFLTTHLLFDKPAAQTLSVSRFENQWEDHKIIKLTKKLLKLPSSHLSVFYSSSITKEKTKKRKRVEEEDEVPPPVEQPSFLRGAIVKPLLLGLLASGSFLVNHMVQTHVPAPTPPQKKNTPQKPEILRNETIVLPRKKTNSVPGFD